MRHSTRSPALPTIGAADQAEQAGEHGLAAEFDTIIADETHHRDEPRQILARWS